MNSALRVVADQPKRVGLVVRVSTDRQAANDEGSLKTQLQRTRGHIDYKRLFGEDWRQAGVYQLPAVSGKHSLLHPEMMRLRRDIALGRVNVVLCTELSRASRNVAEFLEFVAYSDLRPYNQERIFKGQPNTPRKGFNFKYGKDAAQKIAFYEDYHKLLEPILEFGNHRCDVIRKIDHALVIFRIHQDIAVTQNEG